MRSLIFILLLIVVSIAQSEARRHHGNHMSPSVERELEKEIEKKYFDLNSYLLAEANENEDDEFDARDFELNNERDSFEDRDAEEEDTLEALRRFFRKKTTTAAPTTTTTTTAKPAPTAPSGGLNGLINGLTSNKPFTSAPPSGGGGLNGLINSLTSSSTAAPPVPTVSSSSGGGLNGLINSLTSRSTAAPPVPTISSSTGGGLNGLINLLTSKPALPASPQPSVYVSTATQAPKPQPQPQPQPLPQPQPQPQPQPTQSPISLPPRPSTQFSNSPNFPITPSSSYKACITNPCKNNGICTPDSTKSVGFTCKCGNLFAGEYCENMNNCFSNPCKNGGMCHNLRVSFYCACAKNFHGDNCEKSYDAQKGAVCTTNPCLNGGTCHQFSFGPFCQCPGSHYGSNCESAFSNPYQNTPKPVTKIPYNPKPAYTVRPTTLTGCATKPCRNMARCEDLLGGYDYYCHCTTKWMGKNCDRDVYYNPTNFYVRSDENEYIESEMRNDETNNYESYSEAYARDMIDIQQIRNMETMNQDSE